MEELNIQDLVWINLALAIYEKSLHTQVKTFTETKDKVRKELFERASKSGA